MMEITPTYIWQAILVTALATFITRALPFFLLFKFRDSHFLQKLGRNLPAAIVTLLLIFCLVDPKAVITEKSVLAAVSAVVVALLHVWMRNALLSIGLGTVCYILGLNFLL